MKKIILLLTLILSTSFLYASFFDTGYVQWKQPNGVEFTARLWGDEFESQMETSNGYRIKIGVDNYYYYAELDTNGDYRPSTYKVGIDAPLYSSYHLERSSAWNATLQARIDSFNAQLELNYQAYLNKMASGDSTYKFGVVLIDFTPSEKHLPNAYPLGYYSSFYDSMIFSRNYWIGDSSSSPHPEHLSLFGSFADYYDDQSNGKIKFVGRDGERKIVNPDTMIGGIGYPKWVVMDSTKGWYAQQGSGYRFVHFLEKAESQLGINLDTVFDKIAFIYAGSGDPFGRTAGVANGVPGTAYMVSEVGLDEIWGTFFLNIGGHCHEFGHTIGLDHIGNASDSLGFYWNLMGSASHGPRYRGACPPSITPRHVVEVLQWANYDTISSDTTLTVQYEPGAPKYYYTKSRYSNVYWILENRLRRGFDLWTPHNETLSLPADADSIDPNHNIGGLLIWRYGMTLMVADATPTTYLESVRFEDYHKRDTQRDPFPFNRQDGLRSGLDFNDYTNPGSNVLDGSLLAGGPFSHVAINNLIWNPSDSSTTVSIEFNNNIDIIASNTTWSGVHVVDRDVVVKSGATLTIAPGTTVIVGRYESERFSIHINSGCSLKVEGTSNSPITFRSEDGSGLDDWDGIDMESGSSIVFHDVTVKNAVTGLSVEDLSFDLTNCRFDSCEIGLHLIDCSSDIRSSSFVGSAKGIVAFDSELDIEASTFSKSSMALDANGGSLVIRNTAIEKGRIQVSAIDTSCWITHCLFTDSSSLDISNHNDICSNTFIESGINVRGNDAQPFIANNEFRSSTGGRAITMAHVQTLNPTIENNLFAGHEYATYCEGDPNQSPNGFATPVITNNILYMNTLTDDATEKRLKGNGTAIYNCIYNNDTATYTPPANNIEIDPQFVNASGGDFRLKYSSPCIDAGDPNDEYSLEPEPNGGRINMGHHGNTENATGTFNIIASSDLASNTTWQNYVIVTDDISTSGHDLTVSPGARVFFDSSKTVTIDAGFTSNGILTNPIYYRGFHAADIMGGLVITGDDDVSIKYSNFTKGHNALTFSEFMPSEKATLQNLSFKHNTRGIFASKSDITVETSVFDSNQTGLTSQEGTLTVSGSSFLHNSSQGVYLFESASDIEECTFEHNGLRGLYYHYSSDGSLEGSSVRFNGSSLEDTYLKAGIVCYQSSPTLDGNHLSRNSGPGIMSLAGSYPVMTLNGVLHNRPANPTDETNSEIYAQDFAVPLIDQGHNDIYDSLGGYYLYHEFEGQSEVLYATENYWGTTDEETIEDALYPSGGFIFDPYDESPNTGFSKSIADSVSENLFRQAYHYERDQNYPEAMVRYDSILTFYPGTYYALAALDRNFVLMRKTGTGADDLRQYVSEWSGDGELPLQRLAKRLSLRCLTLQGQYSNAIENHQLWQATTTLVNDSIYSELDILTNELLGSGRSLGKGVVTLLPMQKSAALTGYERESQDIMRGLFRSGRYRKSQGLPLEFGLSQNYPNPFNPATTIRYQIPQDSRVTLKVYNILGQEVATLVHKSQPAGFYTVEWNGKNRVGHRVSSGIYIYRMVAHSGERKFVKSKKMMVLK